jgi:hypothetical protein
LREGGSRHPDDPVEEGPAAVVIQRVPGETV